MRKWVFIFCVLATASRVVQAGDLQSRIEAAGPGDVIEVHGGIHGPIRTDKPITLIGHDWPVIDGGGESDCVLLVGGASRISGFVIRNSGSNLDRESCGLRIMGADTVVENNRFENVLFGIDLKNAPNCIIRNNIIGSMPLDIARRGDGLRLYRSNKCLIEGNTIEDGRDALLWYSNDVIVRGNQSHRNRYGFHTMFANNAHFERNDITDNSVGIYLMYGRGYQLKENRISRNRGPSGYAIGLKEVDQYEITGNVLAGNRVAIYLDGSPLTRRPGKARITGNNIVFNDIGFSILPAVKGNLIERNNLIDNIEQFAIQGRGNAMNNQIDANYWSDYTGYDRNRDGTGDQPYESRRLFESLTDREPRLRLMLFSPAHNAIEFIGRAMPAVQPMPKFSDTAPYMKPLALAILDVAHTPRHSMAWAAAVLLVLPAMVALHAWRHGRTSEGRGK